MEGEREEGSESFRGALLTPRAAPDLSDALHNAPEARGFTLSPGRPPRKWSALI